MFEHDMCENLCGPYSLLLSELLVTVYIPQMFAFGINRSNVAWDFTSIEGKGIWGNKRDLLLVVRSPKDSVVCGRFLLGADVEFKVMKVPVSKREDEIVDVEYDLCG
jgi:hypothetical protein